MRTISTVVVGMIGVGVVAACDYNITWPSPNGGGDSQSQTVTVTVTVVPPTSVPPTNTTPPGPRTPDPPTAGFLPLPSYGASVVAQVAAQQPSAVQQSCLATYGATAWTFLDRVIDTLRAQDTRWGYNCKRGDCTMPSQDAIAYHATAGPDVTGATGVWIIDIIGNHCPDVVGLTPTAQYENLGYDATGRWTSRGRF